MARDKGHRRKGVDTGQAGGIDALAPYRLTERAAVLRLLRRLCRTTVIVTATPDGSDDAITTTIVEVDAERDRLVLDYGPDPDVNRQLLLAGGATIVTHDEGVRVVFRINNVAEQRRGANPGLVATLPASVARVQRRRFYRLPLPRSGDFTCLIQGSDADAGLREYAVLDVSLGGLALMEPDGQALDQWPVGSVLRDVAFHASDYGELPAVIEVLNRRPYGAHGRHAVIGCRWRELTGPDAAWLERLIRDQERRYLAARGRGE